MIQEVGAWPPIRRQIITRLARCGAAVHTATPPARRGRSGTGDGGTPFDRPARRFASRSPSQAASSAPRRRRARSRARSIAVPATCTAWSFYEIPSTAHNSGSDRDLTNLSVPGMHWWDHRCGPRWSHPGSAQSPRRLQRAAPETTPVATPGCQTGP